MQNQEFSPRESLERAFKHWWIIVFLTVLGGIAGWAVHFFRTPLYEATATLAVNMDYQKRYLTQYEEDYAFGSTALIATSEEVENQIITETKLRGIPIDLYQLQQQMFLERKQSVWELHIRNQNPEIAAELANLWAEKFSAALNSALGHAIQADQIQTQIDAINNSLSYSIPELSPESQTVIQNLTDELKQEKQASQGVISVMKFSLAGSATIPPKPILYDLANLVLAGACIGFVVSLWVAQKIKVGSRD
jgi:uncharacterized protein involved in exopolysaccharide biosynthesis